MVSRIRLSFADEYSVAPLVSVAQNLTRYHAKDALRFFASLRMTETVGLLKGRTVILEERSDAPLASVAQNLVKNEIAALRSQ